MSHWSTYYQWWIKYLTVQVFTFKSVNSYPGWDTVSKCSCSWHKVMSGRFVYPNHSGSYSWKHSCSSCCQQKTARKMNMVWTRQEANKVEKTLHESTGCLPAMKIGEHTNSPRRPSTWKYRKNERSRLSNITVVYDRITIAWITLMNRTRFIF